MAEMKSITLNGKKYDSFVDAEARQLIKNMGNGQPGGTVTDEQIVQAVVDYLAENPVEGGMTKTEKDLILSLFRNAAYTSANMGNTLTQLEALWSGSGEDSGGDVHSHSYTSAVTKAATCTTAGVRTYTCSCGHSYTEAIPATGHKWNDGVVTVEPEEGKEGVRTYTCTVCGETYTETIPALDHEHTYTSTVIAPTCTEQGYTEHTCACGHSYKDTYVSATGHTFVDGVCTVCGAADPSYVPEVNLTDISATYSGGNVAAGTAVSALSGIVVTAHYSDGSTEAVTGYTLSGTIAEGNNTITVSYNGMTTTFTVTGVAESDGTDWTANEAYTDYNWTDGAYIDSNAGFMNWIEGYSASGYMPCAGASTLKSSHKLDYGAFYDSNKTYLSAYITQANDYVEVPENAAFFRIAGKTGTVKTVSIIPDYVPEVASGWEDGVPYVFETWQNGYCAGSYVGSHADFVTSDYMPCYGASMLKSGTNTTYEYAAWYDADKKFISKFDLSTANGCQKEVPENASYFRISKKTGAVDPTITPHA